MVLFYRQYELTSFRAVEADNKPSDEKRKNMRSVVHRVICQKQKEIDPALHSLNSSSSSVASLSEEGESEENKNV